MTGDNQGSHRADTWNGLANSVGSVLVRRDAFLDKPHGANTPALVVSGADDTILPTTMNRWIADRMPNAEAIEIEGAAHLVPVERP
ncbi:alpha/beta fold hydrolase [Sphingomonas mollis]|uniref:Serine hydrolase domain-containing protein n=1 Tax=Sphingomonas mollis TaxID=2795726 RepID=A0ABS0XUC8_9SPHN|nr:alpha/beta hydrolase [Sphingomonas sp. BT553]MBJ6123654.1 hypothetical protein [Sphingomonas sp. BT553]